jgi:hypothetical protein
VNECGYEDESYFGALVRQYRDACLALPALDASARRGFLARLRSVRDRALMGYGVQDEMDVWLAETASELVDSDESPGN